MTIYKLTAGSHEELCDFLNICIENYVEFDEFTRTWNDDFGQLFTAEFGVSFPIEEMGDLIEDLNKEKGTNVSLGNKIYKNIDNEIRRIKSTCSLNTKESDSLDEVETQLGELQKGLLTFVKVHEKVEDYRSQIFFHKHIRDLDLAIYFLRIIRKNPDMEEVSDNLIIIFEQLMKAYKKYKFDLTNWDDTKKDSELVEEAIEKKLDEELYEFKTAYFDLSKEFFEKLDLFIGENTVFKMPEEMKS